VGVVRSCQKCAKGVNSDRGRKVLDTLAKAEKSERTGDEHDA
jgi:hypothetical protein